MATITDYVNYDTIVERVNIDSPADGERMWNEDEMLEWVGQAIAAIGGVLPYEEKVVTLEIIGGKAELPPAIRDIKEVLEAEYEIPLEDVSTEDTRKFSYYARGGTIFTDFDAGHIVLRYLTPPIDGRGYPLILDNEKYILGVVSFCLEKIAKRMYVRNKLDINRYTIYTRDKSYHLMSARNATRNTNPDRLANLQREVLGNPYKDVRRKRSRSRWH